MWSWVLEKVHHHLLCNERLVLCLRLLPLCKRIFYNCIVEQILLLLLLVRFRLMIELVWVKDVSEKLFERRTASYHCPNWQIRYISFVYHEIILPLAFFRFTCFELKQTFAMFLIVGKGACVHVTSRVKFKALPMTLVLFPFAFVGLFSACDACFIES